MNLLLQRDDMTDLRSYGTFALSNGVVLAETIELPWKENARDVSCIPAGIYDAELRFSPHHGFAVYGFLNVPDRSDIEIHIANDVDDLLGCIGVGTVRGTITVGAAHQVDAVLNSKVAFKKFMETMGVPHYELLTSDEAVRGYKLLHPEAGKFTLTILDAARDA